jgi:hypothetical protein
MEGQPPGVPAGLTLTDVSHGGAKDPKNVAAVCDPRADSGRLPVNESLEFADAKYAKSRRKFYGVNTP